MVRACRSLGAIIQGREPVKINRIVLLLLSATLWATFAALSLSRWNGLSLLDITGFLSLIIVPGLLITLCLRAGYNLPFWVRTGQSMGLSLLLDLVWVLLCNTVLPHLHVHRPLDQKPVLIELGVMNILVGIWSWPRLRYLSYFVTRRKFIKSRLDTIAAIFPIIFVVLAVMGAISLNNGSTGRITLGMLWFAGAYFFVLLALRRRLADSSIAWALYFISLSLLLMTSMRGWYITGHDIQHEYLVFQLTQSKGVWNIANFRDPYNSCLSITILPTIFFNTLHIGSQYVYKILFQVIFAVVPVLMYQIMRLYVSKAKAVLSVIYFVSFPTYFTDMSFLNLQEIAYLFLTLMLLFVLNRRVALKKRQLLFMLFGFGVVLSHYSTTYAVLLVLVVAVSLRIALGYALPRMAWLTRMFKHSSIDILQGRKQLLRTITVPMVLILITAGFVWNVVLTDTANGATSLISQVADAFKNGLNAGTRSNDVSYSLLSSGKATPQELLDGYLKTDEANAQTGAAPKGTYYSSQITSVYKLTPGETQYTPLTRLGRFLESKKLNIFQLNYQLKQSSAKLVQVLAIIGLCYVLVSSGFSRVLDTDYFTLSIGNLIFVVLQVVLPFLSVAYGLLRAFQQALMLVGLYLVAGTYGIARIFVKVRPVAIAIPVVAALGFYLSSTGVLSAMFGGYEPQLQLSNSGVYYDEYYMHAQELAADTWVVGTVVQKDPHVNVQTDLDTAIRLESVTGYQAQNDITPSLIKTYSYVLLGYNDTTNKQVFVSYDGNTLTYNYPTQFLNANKDLIYSNGASEVYH
jgi:uncharacterized membrane protein